MTRENQCYGYDWQSADAESGKQCRRDAVDCPMCGATTFVCAEHLADCPVCHKPICDECRFEHACNGRQISIQTIAADIRAAQQPIVGLLDMAAEITSAVNELERAS